MRNIENISVEAVVDTDHGVLSELSERLRKIVESRPHIVITDEYFNLNKKR